MDSARDSDLTTAPTRRVLGERSTARRPGLARTSATRSGRRRGSAARLLIAAAAGVLVWTATMSPAAAHGADGDMTVLQAEQTGPLTISVSVGLVYSNDQEFAEDASVEVSATLDGTVAGPEQLERDSSPGSELYVGELTVPGPGVWTVEITSTDPASSASATVTVDESDDSDTTTSTAPTTSETSTTAAEATSTTVAPIDDTEDDDSSPLPWIIVGVIAVALVAGLLGWLAGNRGKSDSDGEGGPTAPGGDGAPPSTSA